MKKYLVRTYGCQMNYSDTERIKTVLENLGMREAKGEQEADMIIYNTCSVKQKAEDKVYGQLHNDSKLKQKPLLGITGCMVRKTGTRKSGKKDKLLNRLKKLDFVFRIEDLGELAGILGIGENSLENYFKITPKYTSKVQAFVPIGTGCDKYCAYCIVPFARGREKSRHPDEIFEECKKLVENGCVEITLLGQTVDSYGLSDMDKKTGIFEMKGKETPFGQLLRRIDTLKGKGLERLRFTSSHPKDFTDQLIETIAELETLMPYIHLPVQAGDNEVLKRMNRTYTIEQFMKIINKIKKEMPDCAISTDVIVGFCGETDEEFFRTCKMFEKAEFDHAYISRYSPRMGTVSAKTMEDDVSGEEKARRWHRLNDLLKRTAKRNLKKHIGKKVNVLVEKWEDGVCNGRSEYFKEVQFGGSEKMVGKIVPVEITGHKEWILTGACNFKKVK
ncbi:MAG: tRNA (N6-isopentenyl adenosine(37)-C2)-methylthiotransferase MiaB [Patescibacteria group bacterium]|nr:tRNA (N6-isopentenyl adenosine(37)-C2)-methylthiotransferase MiaB [Patescibacteria group bacterium]